MKIYLIGFMGCGKSHWGKLLSRKLQIPYFDLDEQIVANEGRSINDIFEQEGEEYFRLKEKEVLYILTESHDDFVMACGGGTPCFFNNIDYMNRSGVSVWISSSIDSLFERLIKEKEKRPLIRELSDEQLFAYITKKYADRRIYYQQATVIIDDEVTLEKLMDSIYSESSGPRRKW
jgi:shikimate kinase